MRQHVPGEQLKMNAPANYRIIVHGPIDRSWSDRLAGMNISENTLTNGVVDTILVGRLLDQAALSGVLNTLYELHLPVYSVQLLDEDEAGCVTRHSKYTWNH